MPPLNFAVFAAARNGTIEHTIDPSSETGLVAGAAFSPTAGRFLGVVAYGPALSSTPIAWTLPTNGSAINNGAGYLWLDAAEGGDTFTTTHNASNAAVCYVVLEYAAGTTFVKAASATGASASAPNPTISALTGVNEVFGVAGFTVGPGDTPSMAWDGANDELVDEWVAYDSGDAGWALGICRQESYSGSSYAPVPTITGMAGGNSSERLTFALNVPAAPEFTDDPEASGTAQVGETLTTTNGTVTGSPTPEISYQWQRDNEGGFAWADVSGETDDTLVLTDADRFCNVRCVVTAENAEGDDTATSNTVGPVAAAPLEFTFRLSGGASNTAPASSLGGAESSHAVNGAALFGSVSAEDAEAGLTEYRWVYLHNEDTEDATVAVYLVDSEAFPGREFFAVGVASEAAGETVDALPNATTAPDGVSFGTGSSAEDGEDAVTVTAGDGKAICIRRTIPAETPSGVPHNEARIRFEISPVE